MDGLILAQQDVHHFAARKLRRWDLAALQQATHRRARPRGMVLAVMN
jgi:hypothetical protein